jgi:hypothetical protein
MMSVLPTPLASGPPWRVRLDGRPSDLTHLMDTVSGSFSVTFAEGDYWLQGRDLDEISVVDKVRVRAEEMLSQMNALARVSRIDAAQVKGTYVQGTDGDGNWSRTRYLYASVKVDVLSSVKVPLNLTESILRLAESDKAVRAVVQDLSGKRDFATARRIGETVLLDVGRGDVQRGMKAIVAVGWVTPTECARFWRAANFGDGKSVGAHSPLRRVPTGEAMGFGEAWDFVRVLLGKWLDSK